MFLVAVKQMSVRADFTDIMCYISYINGVKTVIQKYAYNRAASTPAGFPQFEKKSRSFQKRVRDNPALLERMSVLNGIFKSNP